MILFFFCSVYRIRTIVMRHHMILISLPRGLHGYRRFMKKTGGAWVKSSEGHSRCEVAVQRCAACEADCHSGFEGGALLL